MDSPIEDRWERFDIPCEGGAPFITAHVPRIERSFESTLHTVSSEALVHEGWISLMAALRAGRLPFVRLDLQSEGWSEDGGARVGQNAVIDALQAGYAAAFVMAEEEAYVYADVALTDRIADTIDLGALRADIVGWLRKAGVWDQHTSDEVDAAITELEAARYSQYVNRVTDLSTFDLTPAIVLAIVTGSHPATAIAFYLSKGLDDDWYWHPFDETPAPPGR